MTDTISPQALSAQERFQVQSDTMLASAFQGVERALHSMRSHLGMDVAFISEFIGDHRVFRHVDAKTSRTPIKRGDVIPLQDGYCKKIVDGHLPELIPDTALVPEAMKIPATRAIPIGSHLSVPLRLSDGHVYGTFCCFSFSADISLNERDLHMMKAFAELIAYQIDTDLDNVRHRAEKTERIMAALASQGPSIVYQPTFLISDMLMAGAEALSRFHVEPTRSPDQWFAEAGDVGLKTDLERKAISNALAGYRSVWKKGPFYLGLNSSPQTIIEGELLDVLDGFPVERIVLEITEHDHVESYKDLSEALAPLRARGVLIAIDDAGSGYASMRHILNIHPDIIKLDISLTSAIDHDPMKRALAYALIEFGRQTNCKIVAEGVETATEMVTLRELGVHAAQGYHLGRPIPVEDLLRLVPRRMSPAA